MEQNHRRKLVDISIILGMMIFVFLMCQPLGRNWDEGTKEMFTGEEGVYSPDADTFYYLRKAKEYTENGFTSIRFFVSRENDSLRSFFAREGEVDSMPVFLSAIAAIIWYGLQAIGIRAEIYSIATHLCGVLLALCTIPCYLFLKKRVCRMAAVCGTILGILSTAYLQHSITGFFDTDALICLCALMIVFSLYDCILSKKPKKQVAYGLSSLVGVLILAATWSMFQIYVVIAIGTGVAAILITRWFFVKKNEAKLSLKVPIFVMITMVAIVLVIGWREFYLLIRDAFFSVKGSDKWPAAYENVSEMARPRILSKKSFWEFFLGLKTDYVSYLGGLIASLALVVSAIIYSIDVFRRKYASTGEKEESTCQFFMIIIWFLGAIAMSFFGIRFTQFLVLPSIVIWAHGVDVIQEKLSNATVITNRMVYVCVAGAIYATMVFAAPVLAVVISGTILLAGFFFSRFHGRMLVNIMICVALLSGTVMSAFLRGKLSVPLLEKPTANAMTWIRENTDKKSVIVDFWSWGYRYQYYSERRTVADGGAYNGAINYWLGTMLFTDDEELSIGIARMLQNCGEKGSDYAVELCGGEAKACSLLKQILGMTREEAALYLEERGSFSKDEVVKLLSYTHPDQCPDLYFVADYDDFMLSSAIGKYPYWDFSETQVTINPTLVTENSIEKPQKDSKSSVDLWAKGLTTKLDLIYKWDGDEIVGQVSEEGALLYDFSKIVYIKDGKKTNEIDKTEPEENAIMADGSILIIIEEEGRLSGVVSDERILNSVLFRLYLCDGEGMESFVKVFSDEIPERISGETSQIQRKLGTKNTRAYRNCGITVWKVNLE